MNLEKLINILSEDNIIQKIPKYRVVFSFIARDFKIAWTYKFWLSMDIFGMIIFVTTYYIFSLITTSQQIIDAGYKFGGYFTFALIGIAFQNYVFFAVRGINTSIRDEQWNGTLEIILTSSTDFKTFLLGEISFFFILSSIQLFIALLVGYILGASFCVDIASIFSTFVISGLLIASHMSIGILSAGIIMKTKQGNPLAWAFSWITQLVSGVFYPLNLLPWYLEWIGKIFPLTYSLDGIRLCLQDCQNLFSPAITNNIGYLALFTIIAAPLGLFIFKKGYDSARRDGSLGQY